jgi:hypothetical protein
MKGLTAEKQTSEEGKFNLVEASGDDLFGNVHLNEKERGLVEYRDGVLVGGNRDKKGYSFF